MQKIKMLIQEMSPTKKVVTGAVFVLVLGLLFNSCETKRQAENLKLNIEQLQEANGKYREKIIALNTQIESLKYEKNECSSSLEAQRREATSWKLKYYDEVAMSEDCESMVDRAIIGRAEPNEQGVILARYLSRQLSQTTTSRMVGLPPDSYQANQP